MLKFLSMHEPTGYEKDEVHKRLVVQYFAIRSLLAECKAVKVSASLFQGFTHTGYTLTASCALYVAAQCSRSMRHQGAALVRGALGACSGEWTDRHQQRQRRLVCTLTETMAGCSIVVDADPSAQDGTIWLREEPLPLQRAERFLIGI